MQGSSGNKKRYESCEQKPLLNERLGVRKCQHIWREREGERERERKRNS
jgi:hypothetical protein